MHRAIALSLVATLAVGAVLAFASSAQAHDAVVASTPSEGETLTTLPAEFSITASQTIVAPVGAEANFGLRITDAAGLFYQDGCVSIVDASMSTPAALGEAGAYTLIWQYVSSDGHPTSGTVPFTWAPPVGFEPTTGTVEPRVCGEDAPAPTPEPEMTTQAEEPSATPSPVAADDDNSSTLLWLGGGALAIVVAIGATLLLVRPKKKPGDETGAPPVE